MSASTALSLLGGGSASTNKLYHGFGSSGGDSTSGGGNLSADEVNLFMTSYDLKRLDMYSHNMVDHHLVTDLIPNLARLYFMGYLNDGVVSLSMVQKALLLGVGLQHRSVDDLSVELNLPVNQVLALFNKAVRKLNSHLKQIVESDVEQNLMASKKDAKKAARATENMTQTSKSLQEDMHDGAAEVMQNMRDKEEEDASNKKKNKKNQSNSSGAVAALLSEDQDLMAYAIKGDDEEWEKATQGGKKALSSISLKNDNKRSLLADGDGGESKVGRILNEAEEERAANEKKNKKKKPKILGGGFNETADKKKNKKHAFKKPEGKYKNV